MPYSDKSIADLAAEHARACRFLQTRYDMQDMHFSSLLAPTTMGSDTSIRANDAAVTLVVISYSRRNRIADTHRHHAAMVP